MVNRPHYRYPDGRLLVFAKPPVPGRVKTRLEAVLSPDECAALHQRLVERTLDTATGSGLCPVQLWCAGEPDHPFFRHCRDAYGLELHSQVGGDLGRRMLHALEQSLESAAFAVLVGGDCPALTERHLEQACRDLGAHDIALVPAEDGGYVLIGARRVTPAVFAGVTWGGGRVLDATRRNLGRCGLSWREQPPLWDVDRPEDLARLAALGERTPR